MKQAPWRCAAWGPALCTWLSVRFPEGGHFKGALLLGHGRALLCAGKKFPGRTPCGGWGVVPCVLVACSGHMQLRDPQIDGTRAEGRRPVPMPCVTAQEAVLRRSTPCACDSVRTGYFMGLGGHRWTTKPAQKRTGHLQGKWKNLEMSAWASQSQG